MKVSIIMPSYNSSSTIVESVKSVLAQTYCNWELIIVDDCSTDDTYELIQSFLSDKRITCYRLERNSGAPSSPRNLGIDKSNGDVICFLDSDDIWYPEKLEAQITYMEDNKLDFTYSTYDIYNIANSTQLTYHPLPFTNYRLSLIKNVIGCLTVAVRRTCLSDARFKHIGTEDYEFWLRILKEKNITAHCCSDRALAQYRVYENSRSSGKLKLIKEHWNIFYNEQRFNVFLASFVFLKFLFNYFLKYK